MSYSHTKTVERTAANSMMTYQGQTNTHGPPPVHTPYL